MRKKIDLKSALCRLNYPRAVIRNRLLKRSDPVIAVLVVNNKCNLRCNYCFGSYDSRGGERDYTTKELFDIIDELYAMGTRMLTVHGGETLLRDDIGEVVRHIKKKGMYIHFVTNGILLKKKIDTIRGVDSLCISLDGAREGHEANRGRGTFAPVLEAIKLARREGFHVRVQGTLTKHTKNDVEYLARLAREIGFFQEFSILYQCGKVTQKQAELALNDDEIRKVFREIIEWKRKGFPIYTSYDVLERALEWPLPYSKRHITADEKLPDGFRPIPCHYGRTKFIIEADGNVHPCFATTDIFKPLNLRDVGLKKAMQHVRETNRCRHCIYLTNNDHNLLLDFSIKHVFNQCRQQLRELMGVY